MSTIKRPIGGYEELGLNNSEGYHGKALALNTGGTAWNIS